MIGLPDGAVVVDARIRVARPQRPHRREELVAIDETAFLPEQVRQLRDRGLPVDRAGLDRRRSSALAGRAGAAGPTSRGRQARSSCSSRWCVSTARSLLRGDVGVDAIALVAIVWALALGEFLAAAIVALMMSGGAALEAWAAGPRAA